MQAKKNSSDPSGLVKKTDYSAKISKVERKIQIISDITINSALHTLENKIPDVRSKANILLS